MEDHGERHIPAAIVPGRKVYGLAGEPDILHLRREMLGGARAVEKGAGIAPRWHQAATARYDARVIGEIEHLGFGIAGFSVNADADATLSRDAFAQRVEHVRGGGDVTLAHMNHPNSAMTEGLGSAIHQLLWREFVFVRLDQVALRRTR